MHQKENWGWAGSGIQKCMQINVLYLKQKKLLEQWEETERDHIIN